MHKWKFITRFSSYIFSLLFTLTLGYSYADGSSHVSSTPSKKDVIVNPNRLMAFESQVVEVLPLARQEIQNGLGIKIPKITIHLSPSKSAMQQIAQEHHHFTPPAWSAGLAYPKSRMVYLPEVSHKELLPLIKHELIHIALGQQNKLPLWVNEGVAVALGDRLTWERLWTLNEAAANGGLLRFTDIQHRFPKSGTRAAVAYAQSAHFIHNLIETHGKVQFTHWINGLLEGVSIEKASETYFGRPFWQIERAWRQSLERGPMAWLSTLMKSENIWSLAIFVFVIGGFRKLSRRKANMIDEAPPLKIKVAQSSHHLDQQGKSKTIFHLSIPEEKAETEES